MWKDKQSRRPDEAHLAHCAPSGESVVAYTMRYVRQQSNRKQKTRQLSRLSMTNMVITSSRRHVKLVEEHRGRGNRSGQWVKCDGVHDNCANKAILAGSIERTGPNS